MLVHVVDSVVPDKSDDGGKVGKDMPLLDCVESSSCVDEGLNSAVNTDVKDGVEEENLESVNEILKWFDGKPLNNKSCEEKKWQHDVDAELRKNTDVVESPNVATGIKSPIGTGNKELDDKVGNLSKNKEVPREMLKEKEDRTIMKAAGIYRDNIAEGKKTAAKILLDIPGTSTSVERKKISASRTSPSNVPTHKPNSRDADVSSDGPGCTRVSGSHSKPSPVKGPSSASNNSPDVSRQSSEDSRKRSPGDQRKDGVKASARRAIDFDLPEEEKIPSKKSRDQFVSSDRSGPSDELKNKSSEVSPPDEVEFLGSSPNKDVSPSNQQVRPKGNPILVRVSEDHSPIKFNSYEYNPRGPHLQEEILTGDETVALDPSEIIVKARGLDVALR